MQRRLSTSHEEGLVARLCTRYAIRTVFFDWSTPREGKRDSERRREKERERERKSERREGGTCADDGQGVGYTRTE